MTEITDHAENTSHRKTFPRERRRPAELPLVVEQFVLQWGDMGSFWGVNRSIAQIHALLYLWQKNR